jgi:hypothetical protein
MKFAGSLLVVLGISRIVFGQDAEGISCADAYGIIGIPNNVTSVQQVVGSMLSQTSRDASQTDALSADVVTFLESSKSTLVDAYQCSYDVPVSIGDSIGSATVIQAYRVCPHNVTTGADCVAVAIYNDTECASVSSCTAGGYSADCSGISTEFPNCKITCDDSTGLATGIDSCIEITFATSAAVANTASVGGFASLAIWYLVSMII